MCRAGPRCKTATGDGIEYIFGGVPIAFFNVALVTARSVSGPALASIGRAATAWAADKDVPWMFVVTHETLEAGVDATEVLSPCDLVPMMPLTGMLAQQVQRATSIPPGLKLTVPDDDDGCSAVLDVNALAYAMLLDAGKDLVGKRSFWKDHVPVLGLVKDTPACSAAVMMVEGHRYVALVATDPAQQRRGYGEAAMRHALQVAADRHGERPTFLHATEAGRPIYERMGYEPVSTHTVFMEKRFIGH